MLCLFVCLFHGVPVVRGGRRLTKEGPYATRRQAEAVLFVRRIELGGWLTCRIWGGMQLLGTVWRIGRSPLEYSMEHSVSSAVVVSECSPPLMCELGRSAGRKQGIWRIAPCIRARDGSCRAQSQGWQNFARNLLAVSSHFVRGGEVPSRDQRSRRLSLRISV